MMRYSTSSSAKICNRSLKSEFIRIEFFHSDPVVIDEFPSSIESCLAACFLPLANAVSPDFVE